MPFAGLGLHVVIALLCAIHAVKTRQQMYWLFILFAFPLLGSLVYFFAIYLPNSRLERGAVKALGAAARALDPERELREARAALDDTPTAQNQMRLAAALLALGRGQEAAQAYERCLVGPFASDPDIRYGAACAFVECGRHAEALPHLRALQQERPEFRREEVALLHGRALTGLGRLAEARAMLEDAQQRHGSFAAKTELAIWAHAAGEAALAAQLDAELDKSSARWNRQTRELNEPLLRRLRVARGGR